MSSKAVNFSSNWHQPLDLANRVAVVSGGATGIGLAIARELDARGCRVVVASRNRQRVAAAAASLGRGIAFGGCDVRETARVEELFDFVMAECGQVDVAVTSAGIGRAASARPMPDPVVSLEEAEFDEVLDTNLRGAFLFARAAARRMVPRRSGQILNISSSRAARRGQPFASGYSASKMAVLVMFQAMREELATLGVRVMSLLPDAVDTSLIASTRLAPRGAMAPEAIGRLAAEMLAMPWDTTLDEPLLAPLGGRSLAGRSRGTAAVAS